MYTETGSVGLWDYSMWSHSSRLSYNVCMYVYLSLRVCVCVCVRADPCLIIYLGKQYCIHRCSISLDSLKRYSDVIKIKKLASHNQLLLRESSTDLRLISFNYIWSEWCLYVNCLGLEYLFLITVASSVILNVK